MDFQPSSAFGAGSTQTATTTWWPWAPDAAASCIGISLEVAERRITVRGELDAFSEPALSDAMASLLALNPGDSTLDLTALTFIDAAGLSCIVTFAGRLSALAAGMIVIGATRRVRRVFALAGLRELVAAR